MPLGLYVSVPFCRAKCSFCNFASGVFGNERIDGYLVQVIAQMRQSRAFAADRGLVLPETVDTIYLGGGTPSLLNSGQIEMLFAGVQGQFAVERGAEMTVECAPGQVDDAALEAFQRAGVDRLSFGVQSFVDRECTAVGRSHTAGQCVGELERVRRAGVKRVAIDLICGLPHQTFASWRSSIEQAIATEVEHVSIYMLEVDEGSRLGRESMLGGVRYGAAALPPEDAVADWYAAACEWLQEAGIHQYEISNFARAGGQSRHNTRYWRREPYLGLGLDAHSMLRQGSCGVRWSYGREMDTWQNEKTVEQVGMDAAFEESLFLGLRLVEGVSLRELSRDFGSERMAGLLETAAEIAEAGLCAVSNERLWLTAAGRMASNEVFGRMLLEKV